MDFAWITHQTVRSSEKESEKVSMNSTRFYQVKSMMMHVPGVYRVTTAYGHAESAILRAIGHPDRACRKDGNRSERSHNHAILHTAHERTATFRIPIGHRESEDWHKIKIIINNMMREVIKARELYASSRC